LTRRSASISTSEIHSVIATIETPTAIRRRPPRIGR
jgi:hypothetical protein